MKIPKRKVRTGRVSIASIIPWYANLNNEESQMFCILASEYIEESVTAMCIDGVLIFKKEHHSRAVAALRDFGGKVDMDAIRSTFEFLKEKGIMYIDEETGHIRINQEMLEGEWEEVELDDDAGMNCFFKDPKIPGK